MLLKIQDLSFRNNNLTNLPVAISRFLRLTRLDLSRNQLRNENLSASIATIPTLVAVNLSRNCLGPHVPDFVRGLENLQILDLEVNQISHVAPWIAELPQLRVLALLRNPLPTSILKASEMGIWN